MAKVTSSSSPSSAALSAACHRRGKEVKEKGGRHRVQTFQWGEVSVYVSVFHNSVKQIKIHMPVCEYLLKC